MDESGPSTPADLASRETEPPKAPAPDPTSADPNQLPGVPPAPPAPPVLPGAAWVGPSRGWTPPGPERLGRGRLLLVGGVLVLVVLLAASPLVAMVILDRSGTSGPNMQSIGFARGGSECDLTDQARTFPHGVPVRFVMTFSPSLPAGGTATMKLSKDGTELVDFRETYTAAGSTSCIHATYPSLEVGHYRLEVTVSPSMMPPSSGQFDVTP
jgi:hypothetical protein